MVEPKHSFMPLIENDGNEVCYMNTFFTLKPFPMVCVCVWWLLWNEHICTHSNSHSHTKIFYMYKLVSNIVSSSLSRSLSNSFNRFVYIFKKRTKPLPCIHPVPWPVQSSQPFCNVMIRRKRRHYYTRQNVYRVSAIRGCSQRLYTYLFSNVKCQPFQMHSRVRYFTHNTQYQRPSVCSNWMCVCVFFFHGGQRANAKPAR